MLYIFPLRGTLLCQPHKRAIARPPNAHVVLFAENYTTHVRVHRVQWDSRSCLWRGKCNDSHCCLHRGRLLAVPGVPRVSRQCTVNSRDGEQGSAPRQQRLSAWLSSLPVRDGRWIASCMLRVGSWCALPGRAEAIEVVARGTC